jgi:hypothetical protein
VFPQPLWTGESSQDQPSLRDFIVRGIVPRTMSRAIFSRPYGTQSRSNDAGRLVPQPVRPLRRQALRLGRKAAEAEAYLTGFRGGGKMRGGPLRVPLKPKIRLEWGTRVFSHKRIQNIQTGTNPLIDPKQKVSAPFKPDFRLEWDSQRLDLYFSAACKAQII